MLRKIGVGILVLTALGAALFSVACGEKSLSDITPAIGVDQVSVEDNRYGPRVIQVAQGTEVTWTWEGDSDHNVVGDGFESELQDEGTFSHTFETPGSYRYVCSLHGGMTGAVIVTE